MISKNGIVLKNGFFFYAELKPKNLQVMKIVDDVVWLIGDSESCSIADIMQFEEIGLISIIKEASLF